MVAAYMEGVYVFYADFINTGVQIITGLGLTIYDTITTVKMIGMYTGQKRSMNAAQYRSSSEAAKSFSSMSDQQAVNEGITDTTSSPGQRRSWRQSEIHAASDYPTSEGYKYNQSYKVVNGQLQEATYGSSGSVRPDYYSPVTNKVVDVKNYNITTSSGRSNLANNVANQYNQRVGVFSAGTSYEVVIDVYGQNWTQPMLTDVETRIWNLTGNQVDVVFMKGAN